MANAQALNYVSPSSHLRSSPAPRMSDLPAELTTAQLEAKHILTHLLSRLQDPSSKYHTRYHPWISQHPHLPEYCFHLIRPQVWTFLSHRRWSLDSLKQISGDLKSAARGIYLNGILGLDKRVRIYVGQTSTSFRTRVAQHLNFRYRRDNPSLHYHALQKSVWNSFGLLGVVPPPEPGGAGLKDGVGERVDLLLNVLEMWMCLVFRTLPDVVLEEWLPSDEMVNQGRKEGKEGVFGGLNIACPLDQGGDGKGRQWVDLGESDDWLVREYAGVGVWKQNDEKTQEKGMDEEDSPSQRKKKYAENARRWRRERDTDIRVPQWVVFGALAAAVGFILLNSKGGPQSRGRWR